MPRHAFDPSTSGTIPESFHVSFAVQRQREDFQAQPPERRRETMERVRQNVAAHPTSWLAKHWQEIYRLKGE